MDIFKAAANLGFIALLSYIAGSLPTSIIMCKILKGTDIRNYGSGNAGGTNAFRVLGWKAGLLVASIDIFKGYGATALLSQINLFQTGYDTTSLAPVLAGVAAVLGHCFTIFAGFKGGKGVATSAGMLIGISPVIFLICFIVFTSVLLTSGYVSLSSIITAVALPITLITFCFTMPGFISTPFMVFGIVVSVFVVYTHRSNIKRLMSGKENRFDNLRIFKRV